MIKREEFEEWLNNPVTKELKKSLKNQIQEVKDGLIDNIYEQESRAKGMAKGYQNIVDLVYEDLYNV